MKCFAFGVMIAAASVGYAAAQDLTATLRAPVKRDTSFAQDQTVWHCDKDQCRVTVRGVDADTLRACRQFVRRLGPVSAFGTLDASTLARCNGDQAANETTAPTTAAK